MLLQAKAKEVSLKQVDEQTAGGYGIYPGAKLTWATLVFSAEAARWVRAEVWHDQQQGRDLEDGRYKLKVQHSEAPEPVMADRDQPCAIKLHMDSRSGGRQRRRPKRRL